jgi:hypothetical protein
MISEIVNPFASISLAEAAAPPTETPRQASLSGRAVNNAPKEMEIIPVENIIGKAAVEAACSLPHSFKATYGPVGEALAHALPGFSLDVVGIVASYVRENPETDLGLTEALQKANFIGPPHLISVASQYQLCEKAIVRIKNEGPFTKKLNLIIPLSLPSEKYFIFDKEFLEKHILPNCPILESLKVLDIDASGLSQITSLRHLSVSYSVAICDENFKEFARGSRLKSLSFSWSNDEDMIKHVSLFQELTELNLGKVYHMGNNNILSTFKRIPNLKKLRIVRDDPHNEHTLDFSISKIKDHPSLEVLCFEKLKTSQCLSSEYPKTLKTLILKDCAQVSKSDCENLQVKHGIQVIYIDSTQEADKGKSKLQEFFTFA